MAENLVIKHGNKGSLPSKKTKGTIYFAQDSSDKSHGKIYYDDPVSNTRADMTGCGYDMGNGAEIFNSYSGTVKNLATASCAHAEGQNTQATDLRAHAEGYGTIASEEDSHAEGNCTNASGVGAHAEGIGSSSSKTEFGAKGRASHSEGELTLASGNYSHAGGVRTIAASDAQTAIGKYNIKDDSGTYLFIVGNGTGTSARSNAFTVDKDGNIKSKGNIYANDNKILPPKEYLDGNFAKLNASNQFTGEQKFLNTKSNYEDHASGIQCSFKASRGFFNQLLVDEIYIPKEKGNISIIKYSNVTDSSMSSPATIMTITSSTNAIAHGTECAAIGQDSYAGGYNARTGEITDNASTNPIAAHAEGRFTEAKGFGAHAEGNGDADDKRNVASGIGAHAEGYISNATGSGAHSEGRTTSASGDGAHSEGYNTKATGQGAHSEGESCESSGQGAHVEGVGSKSSASAAHAEGDHTSSSGTGSHSEGQNTKATIAGSHSEGVYTQATGQGAHAEGVGTNTNNVIASGPASHAEGDSTKATNQGAHAEGVATVASGIASHAGGYYTKASSDNQTVIGKYNSEDSNGTYSFIIGKGNSATKSNALAVDWDGNIKLKGTVYVNSNNDSSGGTALNLRTLGKKGTLDWNNTNKSHNDLVTIDCLAFWDGAYQGSSSNLTYCAKGAFGDLAVKNSLSAADVGLITGSYVYSGAPTTSFSFTDSKINGKTLIICSTQDAGNTVARAKISGTTITIEMNDPVTVIRVNYICF